MQLLMTTFMTACLITASTLQMHAAEKKLCWTPEVLMSTKSISDVQVSPDHKSALFVVTEPKMTEEKGTLLSKIYKTNVHHKEDTVLLSVADISSTQPKWSPDGQWIAFLATYEGTKHLYMMSANGGKATALVTSKQDVQTFCWSPDSKKIAFVMTDDTEEAKHQKKTSLAYVYQQHNTVNRLWLVDVLASSSKPKALTSDAYCVRGRGDFGTTNAEFDWSPDAQQIAFAYSPSIELDSFHLQSSLAIIDLPTGQILPLDKQARYEALPRYSPDGKWIAYVNGNSPQKYAIDHQIAICSSEGKHHRFLAPTFNQGPFLAGASLLGWTKDGAHLLFFEPKGTKFHLTLLPVDGKPAKELETGDVFFKEPALSYDRSMLGCVVQSPTTPPEAFITNLEDFSPVQISNVNTLLLAYPKIETTTICWNSIDGQNIEGLLTYPVDYKEGKRYPLLVVIHGGPMGFFEETFLGSPNIYPLAPFAQSGFMIFRPNPRGSCGYGKNFRCANYNDWGGVDFIDIMSGIDALIAKGLVDSKRLGVMGWSYGGYMTAWTITQTSRFKAASMGAGLSNLVSMNGTTDLHSFLTDYLGNVTDCRDLYEERSPINYVLNVTTPCLIQHGTDDKRVPVSQSYEFYHALDRLGKETTLVLYPGMEHRLADPNMQLDAMERNLAWFQKLL